MPKARIFAAGVAAALAAISFAGATGAEAHKHRHYGGVAVVIGAPMIYGAYYDRRAYYYPPYYYRGFEPECLRWAKLRSPSGKVKWRCVAW